MTSMTSMTSMSGKVSHGESALSFGKAIPTAYAGVAFRSRLEADAAYLFDRIALGWQYEPSSFLLDSGTHYRPDFLLRSHSLWAETRGYESAEGDAQIDGFAAWIHSGRPESGIVAGVPADYLVLGPAGAVVHEYEGKWGVAQAPAILLRCGGCSAFSFLARGGDESCKAGCSGAGGPDIKWAMGVERGAILVGGTPFRNWLRTALAEGLLPNHGNSI